ncbi:MAG: hypothetical protein M1831_004406 [Alyxoria varia]|nr:MAG: hypothetical protein M1831_004406 [Alyxoria varia]
MSQTKYLITGANRGIGRGLVSHYLSRPSNTVIAAVRDPSISSSQSLSTLPAGPSSNLILVKLISDSTDADDPSSSPATLAQELRTTHNIHSIDVIIPNAAVVSAFPKVQDLKPQDMHEHFSVNVVAVTQLFRAMRPFLLASKNPKFVPIGSAAGSLGINSNVHIRNALYAPTKAALHHLTLLLHHENEGMTIFPVDPGMVSTDMGSTGAKELGGSLEMALVSVEDCVAGLTNAIDNATREHTSGTFPSYNGSITPW